MSLIQFESTAEATIDSAIRRLFGSTPIAISPQNNPDVVLNQNKMLLANSITLLYMLEETHSKQSGHWLTDEKLRDLVNNQEEGRKMARLASQSGVQDPFGITNWFLNIYHSGHSTFYENTEYIRFVTRFPDCPRC